MIVLDDLVDGDQVVLDRLNGHNDLGFDGFDGLNGFNGLDGLNGLDGFDGLNGFNLDSLDSFNGFDGFDGLVYIDRFDSMFAIWLDSFAKTGFLTIFFCLNRELLLRTGGSLDTVVVEPQTKGLLSGGSLLDSTGAAP